jgi:lipopolysaccharide export LptBFGC system permease protein LptF
MIGAAIGAGLKVAGSIIGGAAQARAARKQRAIIDKQKKDNEAWYNRNYYEDSTQRSDAQRAMQMARDAMKSRYNQAQASGVVTGATDESIAAQKAATNQVVSSAASSIAATGDARKDSIDQQYLNTKSNLAQQEAETWKQQGAAIAQAAQGVGNAGSKMFDL